MTDMTDVQRQALYDLTLKKMVAMQNEYGGKPPDQRLLDKAKSVLLSPTRERAQEASTKAVNSAEIHYLTEWASGRIPGKVTAHSAERDANKADSLAEMLDAKGQNEAAAGQRKRAQELRELSKQLRIEIANP